MKIGTDIRNKDPSSNDSGIICEVTSCTGKEINLCSHNVHRCERDESLLQRRKKNNQHQSNRVLGGTKMNTKSKPGGFFERVDEVLAKAYELSYYYTEALKTRESNPDAINALLQSQEYKNREKTLRDNLACFDTPGFNKARSIWVERYFNNVLPKGIGTHLDREARKRHRDGERVQWRALTPMAQAFKEAFEAIPGHVREEYEIYPAISHAMFLKMQEALKAAGKFQEAMNLANVVDKIAEAWTKPLPNQETVEQQKTTTVEGDPNATTA